MQREEVTNIKLAECINYAINKHGEQKDYSGIPYIVHLISVMNGVDTLEEKIVAILHDIVEDTNVKFSDLHFELKLPPSIIAAIRALTHAPHESNYDYIRRVKVNELATKVKLADLKHNLKLERMIDLDETLTKRLNTKHMKAYKQLLEKT